MSFFGLLSGRWKSAIFAYGFAIIGLLALPLHANASQKVYFAGFALAGDASNIEKAFPLTTAVLRERAADGRPLVEAALSQHVATVQNPGIDLQQGLSPSMSGGDSVSMAFVLDWENVAREQIEGNEKLIIDLHGQILVFDFDSKQVIASYPVALQFIHVEPGRATPALEERLVRGMYLDEGGTTLLRKFAERLSAIEIKPSFGNRIQVVSVELEEKAIESLREAGQDESIFRSKIADFFGSRLSENLRVAIVPHSKGAAVGSKMAARFADGRAFQFELPSADYKVHLTVRGFKKALLDENPVQQAWAYASFMRVAVTDDESSKFFMDAAFKFAAAKKVPRDARHEDWPAFQESIYSLIDQITTQIDARDSGWIGKWATGDGVSAQLAEVSRIIARCR